MSILEGTARIKILLLALLHSTHAAAAVARHLAVVVAIVVVVAVVVVFVIAIAIAIEVVVLLWCVARTPRPPPTHASLTPPKPAACRCRHPAQDRGPVDHHDAVRRNGPWSERSHPPWHHFSGVVVLRGSRNRHRPLCHLPAKSLRRFVPMMPFLLLTSQSPSRCVHYLLRHASRYSFCTIDGFPPKPWRDMR